MLNQGNNVPENTIAVFLNHRNSPEASIDPWDLNPLKWDEFNNIVKRPSKKRDWFDKYFYNCLPLTIGNQYGFVITADFSFSVIWDGSNTKEGLKVIYHFPKEDAENMLIEPLVISNFGHGIVTVLTPFVLRTPNKVNLMTINPPNEIIKNATVMTGVVETDNLRMPFTFNIKIHEPNVITTFEAGKPICGFIPIPRYFADNFELKNAVDIFDKQVIDEEVQALKDHTAKRLDSSLPVGYVEKDYMLGQDIYSNKFLDHQKP